MECGMQKRKVQLQRKKHMNQHITRSDLIFRKVRQWLWTGVAALALCGMAGAQELAKAEKPVDSKDAKVSSPEKAAEQPECIVGEGDVLHINVWKENEISQTVVVRPDGNISLPLINEVPVAGLSPLQIQKLITDKLKTILTNPQVTVTVVEVRSKMVYITGEVGRPGAYPMSTPLNVLQLMSRAG